MINIKRKKINDNKPWINYYDEGVPKSFDYPDLMLWEMIEKSSLKYPTNHAYEYYGTKVTFRKFMYEIEEAARSLKSIGVKENDVVSIISANIPQAIISFYAINMVGAIANMIHPLSAVKEIENYLIISKSKYVFSMDIAIEKVMSVLDKTNVEKVIVFSAADKMNKLVKTAYLLTQGRKVHVPYNEDIVISFNTFLDFGYMYDGKYKVKRKSESPAVILYSGGTTGNPKGILLSNLGFNAQTLQTASMIQPTYPGESLLTIMPIFHSFGLGVCVHTPLSLGVKCILIPIFSYKKFGRLIKQYKPNYIVGVPTLLETMINDECLQELDLSFIKEIIVGGDIISDALKEKVDKFMILHGSNSNVRCGYGLTEGSGPSSLLPKKIQPKGSVGVPCQDMLYKIVDIETNEEVMIGKEGEICISGPNVMIGYINNKEETEKALEKDKNGTIWLHTGDIGKMDENGFVYFTQRLKRIIISSGYNLYPSHIENIIKKHSSVKNCCVIGIPHPYKSQVAKAFIVLEDEVVNKEIILKEIKKLCEKSLAKYSIPYEYEFRDDLPKTMIGKIDYKVLEKEEYKKNEFKKLN